MNKTTEKHNDFFKTIEKLKIDFLEQLSTLLEHQITSKNLNKNIVVLEQKKLAQTNAIFNMIYQKNQKYSDCIKNNIEHFNNINHSLDILHRLQNKNNSENIISLKNNLFNLNYIFNKLLSEHNLFIQNKHYATHDVLTGLYNRHYFNTIVNYEINRSKQYKRHNNKFSILMIDLDNFKTINDSFGHIVGDVVLKHIATMLLKSIRHSDLAARLGGDEFVIVLMETDLNQAVCVANRICKKIKKAKLISPYGDTIHTSVSIGVSNYPENSTNAIGLMSSVDTALYKAKSLGKNIIYCSNNFKKNNGV